MSCRKSSSSVLLSPLSQDNGSKFAKAQGKRKSAICENYDVPSRQERMLRPFVEKSSSSRQRARAHRPDSTVLNYSEEFVDTVQRNVPSGSPKRVFRMNAQYAAIARLRAYVNSYEERERPTLPPPVRGYARLADPGR